MNARVLILAAIMSAFAGCKRVDNPLVSATDPQFAQLVAPKNAFSASCAAALYEPELFVQQYNALKFSPQGRINAVTEEQQRICIGELQKRAGELGIRENVAPEHFKDDRVRARYMAGKKK
jgi:hypothetical protein